MDIHFQRVIRRQPGSKKSEDKNNTNEYETGHSQRVFSQRREGIENEAAGFRHAHFSCSSRKRGSRIALMMSEASVLSTKKPVVTSTEPITMG